MKTNQSQENIQNSHHRPRRASIGSRVILALETLFILILLFVSPRDASGDPMNADRAREAVVGWLRTDPSPLQTTMGQQVKRVETFNDAEGAPLYYVVYLDPDGFVIVAADDLVEPIVGFASSGLFDPSTDNPLGALVSNDLPGRIAKARTIQAAQATGSFLAARNKWGRFKSTEQSANEIVLGILSVSDVRVAPLTQTTWNQSIVGANACYNYFTPPNAAGSSANYVCGCVATAMAQLMKFWQCPVNGVGTASYTIYVTDVSQSRNLRGGDGAGGPYGWRSMVLSPTSSSTDTQRQAIGALCADAGVSVHMDYNMGGSGESGAYMEYVQGALTDTFGYANAVCGENGGSNIGTGLNGMVNPNLDAGCPVLFGITDASGDGHAIVCDGYGYNLSTLYHHLNLGWGGTCTAWYNLPNIDTGYYAFNSVDACIYNVWTNGTGEIISGRVTDDTGTPITGAVVTATRSGGGTYTATSSTNGIYALAKVPASSTYTVSASKTGYSFTNRTVTTGLSTDYSATSGNQWAVDFAQIDTNNPTSFSATPVSRSRIDLSWGKNPSNDNVMVAWNTNATFGTPSGTYAAGDPISGGGTVLYNGGATTVSHTGLAAGTTYFYKAWSVRSGSSYSTGAACSATTGRGVPFTEGFENAGVIPNGWTQEYVTGTADWTFQSGGYLSHPASAHGGSYNALLYYAASSDHKTKLVLPMIDFGAATQNAQLTFWHYMQLWPPDQDELRVYYKTFASGSWTLLATYTTSVASWTQQTISLPSPNSTYFVAFEGNAKYGYGVCIDDMAVTADAPPDNLCVTPATGLTSSGPAGGPFTPSSQTYVLTNTGASALNWTAGKTGNWVGLSATNGTLAGGGFTNVSVTLNASALAMGSYSDTITFSNRTSGSGNLTRSVTLTVTLPCIGFFSLDTDPGWTRQGEWAFGHPTGSGGTSQGSPDPANGYTGINVFGVNLSGDYSTTVGGPYYLTAGPLNFTGCTNVILQFKRWLNSDTQPYVYATVDVSSNGSAWTSVFDNGTSIAVTDSAWTDCQYDISATANNRATVYVRWGYQVCDYAFAYSGWNIDDIEFLGLPPCGVPRIGIGKSGTNTVINCMNGTLGGIYYVLASTNLALPRTNWPVVATNTFDGSGCCAFTNGLDPNCPRRYFLLRVP